ncbi:MAG: hypothetical protein KAR40_13995 [Candidatus Sabulitectum sp.]|nr:hypothetical protein [Candidatus Sabulitectum sp.]
MSCNHSGALEAFQKAKDIRALHKLLIKIIDQDPKAVERAWDAVDLSGHLCPICKRTSLLARTDMVGRYECVMCESVINKKVSR